MILRIECGLFHMRSMGFCQLNNDNSNHFSPLDPNFSQKIVISTFNKAEIRLQFVDRFVRKDWGYDKMLFRGRKTYYPVHKTSWEQLFKILLCIRDLIIAPDAETITPIFEREKKTSHMRSTRIIP